MNRAYIGLPWPGGSVDRASRHIYSKDCFLLPYAATGTRTEGRVTSRTLYQLSQPTSWQCWWKLLLKVRHKDRFLQTSGPFCQFFKKVSTQKTKFQNFQRTCWHSQFFFKFWCKFYGHAVDKNGPSKNAFVCPLTFDSSTLFGSF